MNKYLNRYFWNTTNNLCRVVELGQCQIFFVRYNKDKTFNRFGMNFSVFERMFQKESYCFMTKLDELLYV